MQNYCLSSLSVATETFTISTDSSHSNFLFDRCCSKLSLWQKHYERISSFNYQQYSILCGSMVPTCYWTKKFSTRTHSDAPHSDCYEPLPKKFYHAVTPHSDQGQCLLSHPLLSIGSVAFTRRKFSTGFHITVCRHTTSFNRRVNFPYRRPENKSSFSTNIEKWSDQLFLLDNSRMI